MRLNSATLEELEMSNEELSNSTSTSNQIDQNASTNGSWYTGSKFAGILVIILFVVWILTKVGCLGHD